MTVIVRITELKIDPESDYGSSGIPSASAKVDIIWDGKRAISMSFGVTNYNDLNDIADKVRQQVAEFATGLLKATEAPLQGSSRPPLQGS